MKTKKVEKPGICTINDDWSYKGMRVVWIENKYLKIGILIDRGADIFEFNYKPHNLNFLLNLPGRLRNLKTDFSQMRNTTNQFEDHYYGGWQEILPNSAPFNYRGASLGQHGEISMVRIPIKIEKTLTLSADSFTLQIDEKLTNLASSDLELMWGHHIAFGLPFLREGVSIETNAKKMRTEAQMPDHRRFQPDQTTPWPNAIGLDGEIDDASRVPSQKVEPSSDLAYLFGFDPEAFYAIKNERKNVGFALQWDPEVFKFIWYWQERNATKGFPWWGNCYTVALEPWSSAWTDSPEEAISKKEWLRLPANDEIETQLLATAFTDEYQWINEL
jgi:hypothetical protein